MMETRLLCGGIVSSCGQVDICPEVDDLILSKEWRGIESFPAKWV